MRPQGSVNHSSRNLETWCNRVSIFGFVRVRGDGWSLPADMLLLSGAVICNESGLTGESMPVRKFPARNAEPEQKYDAHKHSRHTLFAGVNRWQLDGN